MGVSVLRCRMVDSVWHCLPFQDCLHQIEALAVPFLCCILVLKLVRGDQMGDETVDSAVDAVFPVRGHSFMFAMLSPKGICDARILEV